MKLYPEYSENIIVYVVKNGVGQWYITEKEIWFLDRVAFSNAFSVDPTLADVEFVKDLLLGGELLIKEIEPFKVHFEELTELIAIYDPLSEDEAVLEMRPSLFIDIDKKSLKNLFPEPSGVFEKYAPSSWHASHENFLPIIPIEHVYWVINGKNLFE